MQFFRKYSFAFIIIAGMALLSCGAEGDNPGTEYAPQMYHSVPYEPLSQITDREAGEWLTSTDNGEGGEFYNSNPHNPYNMTMRTPPPNTVPRNDAGNLPVTIPADSVGSTYWLDYASVNLHSPLDSTNADAILQEGTALYNVYCVPCHGGAGQGDGPVGQVMKGVPSFKVGRYANMTEGHIFHVITYGRGRMAPYASQLNPEERWKVAEYVKQLQN